MQAPDKSLIETAINWRARMDDDEASVEDRRAFYAWLRDHPDHPIAYRHAEQFWEGLGQLPSGPRATDQGMDVVDPVEEVVDSTVNPRRRSLALIAFGVAASALFVMLLPTLWQAASTDPPPNAVYETGIGEIRDVALVDGSTVVVGSASRIEVSYETSLREVLLTAGEAYFDVIADSSRPFEVDAGDTTVRVVGTSFNMKRSEATIHVAVAEGIVEVAHRPDGDANPGTVAGVGTGPKVVLEAGQQVNGSRGGLSPVSRIKPGAIAAWRRNRLVYDDTPLHEVIADANRYHAHEIVLEGQRIRSRTVSATFDTRDVDGMLLALSELFGLSIDRSRERQIVLRAAN